MLIKFALADMALVEDRRIGHQQQKVAARTNFDYIPQEGYIYVRSRAISSRVNENFDGFRPEEIKAAWRTFIGKPVFVNHHNEDIKRKRGVIIDAALHEDTNPNGSPDTWAEVLMMIDAIRFPKLAQAIVDGHIDRTSMGTAVAYTLCSFCGNKAETSLQYCQHISSMKGKRVIRRTASGEKEAVLIYEDCHGLGFFENSVLVEDPADPTALAYDVDTRGMPGLQRSAAKVAMNTTAYGEQTAPPEVDTLLPESCPICGNSDSWNGNQCMTCDYEAPPEPYDSPDLDKAKELDRTQGEPIPTEDDKPPLYVGRRSIIPSQIQSLQAGITSGSTEQKARKYEALTLATQQGYSIPSNTVEKDYGMPNTPARGSLHVRLDSQQKQINAQASLLQAIANAVGVTAADVPPQFQKGNDDSGSSSSDSGVNKDSTDYKGGHADGFGGLPSSESKKDSADYQAGYEAGKKDKAAQDDRLSDSEDKTAAAPKMEWQHCSSCGKKASPEEARAMDDNGEECSAASEPHSGHTWQVGRGASLAERRKQAYLMQKKAESDAAAVAPDAKDDPENIGAVPGSANTNVTPDATTSVDSAPTATTLETDDSKKINVETPEPSVDNPPTPDGAKVPVNYDNAAPADNTNSYNTGGPDNISWTAAKDDPQARLFAAMKLAKQRRTAGIESEDELVAAQKIVDDSTMTLAAISLVSSELGKIITAAKQRQAQLAGNTLVPQSQNRTAERSRPSFSSHQGNVAAPSTGAVSSDEFGDLL